MVTQPHAWNLRVVLLVSEREGEGEGERGRREALLVSLLGNSATEPHRPLLLRSLRCAARVSPANNGPAGVCKPALIPGVFATEAPYPHIPLYVGFGR